jgi:hypothetical protein
MTEENPKTNALDLLTKYAASQRHIPTLIESSVSRRGFMRGAAITGLTFAMSPWERALAAHRFPELELIGGAPPPLPMTGFWDGILAVGKILATLLGFGSQFQTVYSAVNYFLDGKARGNATAAIKTLQDEITEKMKKYFDLELHKFEEEFVDAANRPIKTVFGAGNASTGMAGTRRRDVLSAHAWQRPDARRLYVMTLTDKSLNSLVPMFDYGVGSSPYDAKAVVGLPTLKSFHRMWTRKKLLPYNKELGNLIYPQSQPNRAYGVWEQSYKGYDRFETAGSTTLEFHYEHKGAYDANNADPRTVYGELTTIVGQFPEGKTRQEYTFTDTYCWIPPTTRVEPCIG